MSSTKKFMTAALMGSTILWSVGAAALPAYAQTTAELQALIASLQAQIAALQAKLTTGGSTTSYVFTTNLTVGSRGADVSALQQILITKGFLTAVSAPTGYFGTATKAAVAAWQAANGISPALGYFGPLSRAKMNAGGTVTPPVVGAPMTVSLAADSPASANVQKGSANNVVAKFVLTGGSSPVSVTGMTLRSYGTTEATGSTDVSAVRLYDENGVQLGSDRTPTGNLVSFVIVPALTIPANGSRTVTVMASIGTSANTLATVRYGLESAGSVAGATFSGNFPLVGGTFSIVPAGQLGALTVGEFGTLPKTNVKIGEKDIILERFNVAAGSNEDVQVNQIVLSNTGTISDADISNLRIRYVNGGAVVAGPATLSNKKVTFNLSSPITLTKGASVNLEMVGDIANGNGRTIAMSIAAGGVVAKGMTSGTNMTSTGSTSATTVTIGVGSLVVSMSSNHPQGANALLIKTSNKKTIAVFSVRAEGEDIILSTLPVRFVNATDALTASNYLSGVGIYDGDSLVSDLKDVTVETDLNFSMNYTIPANTTKELSVKAITNPLTAATNGDSLSTTWSGYTAYGLSSGETLTSTSDVVTSALTIYPSGKATASNDTVRTPYSQGILAPLTNVTIGAVRVYAQREDLKLTDLVVTVSGTGYDDEADITTVTLYDENGVMLSNPKAYDNGADDTTDTFTFAQSDLLSDVVFTKNAYKSILVKANISNSAEGTTAFTVSVADAVNQMKFTGQDSGTAYDFSTDQSGNFSSAFSSPYAGGTFSFDNTIVEIKKAASSPSGGIGRGTLKTYGEWDLTNKSSDLANAVITSITFTSKKGLPSTLTDGSDNALFELHDENGNVLAKNGVGGATTTLTKANGTIRFDKAAMVTSEFGVPKKLVLKITTTDTSKWPADTEMQWSVEAVGDVTVTGGFAGYGGETWSIPAVANLVEL